MDKASAPIGVFDSGLGGLTILKALQEYLPNEQFIYFGDTAHLPYGEKSEAALISYVTDIMHYLKSRGCKLIVVACNSASTVLTKAPNLPYEKDEIIEVISPIVDLISTQKKYQRIAVIGTRKTIDSGLFDKELKQRNNQLQIVSRATPLLVPLIEEGFSDEQALFPIFDRYFKDFDDAELIIPACTHYPMIYKQIESYFNHKLKVLHTPKIIAEGLKDLLDQNQLNNTGSKNEDEYHLSDLTDGFKREAEMFLGRAISLSRTLLK
ncbi:glutamate racemase [bacterium]|nr:glutamate racemase [bacterium]